MMGNNLLLLAAAVVILPSAMLADSIVDFQNDGRRFSSRPNANEPNIAQSSTVTAPHHTSFIGTGMVTSKIERPCFPDGCRPDYPPVRRPPRVRVPVPDSGPKLSIVMAMAAVAVCLAVKRQNTN